MYELKMGFRKIIIAFLKKRETELLVAVYSYKYLYSLNNL
jgi:hypothetical protein